MKKLPAGMRKAGAAKPIKVYRALLKSYGPQGWWPVLDRKLKSHYNPKFKKRKRTKSERFEICAGAILTQNASWKNAEKALANLKKRGLLSEKAMKNTPKEEITECIRPAGYFNQKQRKLAEFLKYGGPIERESMLKIWGSGPETIDSILLYAYGKPVFVVDAYTKRIASRIGFCAPKAGYGEVQKVFEGGLPKDAEVFNELHALLVEHAKRICLKRNPKCAECVLEKMCKKKIPPH